MRQVSGILRIDVVEIRRGFEKDVANSQDQWLFPLPDRKVLNQPARGFPNDKDVAKDLNNEIFSASDRGYDLWIGFAKTLDEQGLSRCEVGLVLVLRLDGLMDDLLSSLL